MKHLIIYVGLFFLFSDFGHASNFNKSYADQTSQDYSSVKNEALKLDKAIKAFLADTSTDNLISVKSIWTEARKAYSQTEIHRFYGGPIDDEDGPEGLINAWPLDEAYIDYVKGKPESGIISMTLKYPNITKDLLIELNEKDGEANISSGWHAIEFLLWGQDFDDFGPGQRPLSDFIIGQNSNASRRRDYLNAASELLVENIDQVLIQWNKNDPGSYYNEFLNLPEPEALTKVFTSLTLMSSDELAIERIFVAYDTQFQEDEHSCFSDTTHFDIINNYLGIKNVWNVVLTSTNIQILDSNLVAKIQSELASIDLALNKFKPPFDQAIFETGQRAILLSVVEGLQRTGDLFRDAGLKLGASL